MTLSETAVVPEDGTPPWPATRSSYWAPVPSISPTLFPVGRVSSKRIEVPNVMRLIMRTINKRLGEPIPTSAIIPLVALLIRRFAICSGVAKGNAVKAIAAAPAT